MKSLIVVALLASFNALAMEVELTVDPKLKPYIQQVKAEALYKSTQRSFGCWITGIMDERPVFTTKSGNLSKRNINFPNSIDYCRSDLVSVELTSRQNRSAFRELSAARPAKEMKSALFHVGKDGDLNPLINVKCKILDLYTADGLETQLTCAQDVHVIDHRSDRVLINLSF